MRLETNWPSLPGTLDWNIYLTFPADNSQNISHQHLNAVFVPIQLWSANISCRPGQALGTSFCGVFVACRPCRAMVVGVELCLSAKPTQVRILTLRPTAVLCRLTRERLESFRFFPTNWASENSLLNASPKYTSSPQPPHLNSPGAGSFGRRPHEHLVVAPMLHALEMARVRAAEDRAYTNACSLLPEMEETRGLMNKCPWREPFCLLDFTFRFLQGGIRTFWQKFRPMIMIKISKGTVLDTMVPMVETKQKNQPKENWPWKRQLHRVCLWCDGTLGTAQGQEPRLCPNRTSWETTSFVQKNVRIFTMCQWLFCFRSQKNFLFPNKRPVFLGLLVLDEATGIWPHQVPKMKPTRAHIHVHPFVTSTVSQLHERTLYVCRH